MLHAPTFLCEAKAATAQAVDSPANASIGKKGKFVFTNFNLNILVTNSTISINITANEAPLYHSLINQDIRRSAKILAGQLS